MKPDAIKLQPVEVHDVTLGYIVVARVRTDNVTKHYFLCDLETDTPRVVSDREVDAITPMLLRRGSRLESHMAAYWQLFDTEDAILPTLGGSS